MELDVQAAEAGTSRNFPMEDTDEDDLLFDELADDVYNLKVSVAVVDSKSEEVNAEFAEALTEIEGNKSFPCSKCAKVCKSKGGLTKRMNSKHRDATVTTLKATSERRNESETCLTKENLTSIIEEIKTKIIKDDLYGSDLKSAIESISCSEALFDAILPIYNTFCRKQNMDTLLETFYGLLPINAKTYLNSADDRVGNLIMIEIPDRLVGLFKLSQAREESETKPTTADARRIEISPSERGPLSYIAGYIVSKLYEMLRKNKGTCDQTVRALLQSLKSNKCENSFISARSRGELVTPCDDLLGILEEAEICFRKNVGMGELTSTVRNIPIDIIYVSTYNSPIVKSLWSNIVLDSGVDESSVTNKLCLESIIKLYLRVRSFSYARDYISKYKIKLKQTKSKALRKSLKRSKSD